MKEAMWIFLAFFALQLISSSCEDADKSNWQSIDCGNDNILIGDWEGDYDYTKRGSNELVRTKTTRDEFNTLRAFPSKAKDNCYNVPIETQTIRYIIRVGFYYGNYDGLFKPPTFDLFLNDIKWTTVNTSMNNGNPFYEEIIYQNKGSRFFKICLVQIKDGGIPIINSIEIMVIYDELYPKMESNATYNLVTRINLGGPEVRSSPGPYGLSTDEIYNRIWSEGLDTPYSSVGGGANSDPTPENHPPFPVMDDAIEFNASDPITLIADLPQLTPQSAYIVLYMTNLRRYNPYDPNPDDPNKTSTVKIEINYQDQGKVETSLSYGEATVVTKYPVMVSGPTINITLSPVDDGSLPPMIAAMEVFTKWDTGKSAAARQFLLCMFHDNSFYALFDSMRRGNNTVDTFCNIYLI